MDRPRVKSVFPPLPVSDQVIRIGGADFGLAAEITDDEKRHMWQLLGLMDGSRTQPELFNAMRASDPALDEADVALAIAALTASAMTA